MVKLFDREFLLSAKARSLVFTHCAWVLESLAQKAGQLTGELEQGTRSRPKGVQKPSEAEGRDEHQDDELNKHGSQ